MGETPKYWQLDIDKNERGAYLLQSEQWSDCKFLLGTKPKQEVIAGHKLILAMSSPVFETMFYGELPEKNDCIPIEDIDPETFKMLLRYIYADLVEIISCETAMDLYYAANKYMLTLLKKECIDYIKGNVVFTNVCQVYEFAVLFEEKHLIEVCLKKMTKETGQILKEKSVENVQLETLIKIFSLDKLNITSEVELFKAAERWEQAHKHLNNDPQPSTVNRNMIVNAVPRPKSKKKNKRAGSIVTRTIEKNTHHNNNIRRAIEKIRFLTLTPEEFAAGPAKSSLLTQAESLAIIVKIATKDTSKDTIPSGFSQSTLRRTLYYSNYGNTHHCNYCGRNTRSYY